MHLDTPINTRLTARLVRTHQKTYLTNSPFQISTIQNNLVSQVEENPLDITTHLNQPLIIKDNSSIINNRKLNNTTHNNLILNIILSNSLQNCPRIPAARRSRRTSSSLPCPTRSQLCGKPCLPTSGLGQKDSNSSRWKKRPDIDLKLSGFSQFVF